MTVSWRRLLLLMVWLAFGMSSGCRTPPPAPVEEKHEIPEFHTVVWGDTLLEIAFRYGVDSRDLVALNRLPSPDMINVGQRLRLRPTAGMATAPRGDVGASSRSRVTTTTGPARGSRRAQGRRSTTASVESGSPTGTGERSGDSFIAWRWPISGRVERGYKPDVPGRKGIQIGGRLGESVRAASRGEVVYSGSGLPGYGRLIIVKHSESFLSAYGYLGKIMVKEGDSVSSGQTIAELGSSNDNRPVLHFEIRRDGEPVDPLRYLPS
jgi:lipoprotein NlpD